MCKTPIRVEKNKDRRRFSTVFYKSIYSVSRRVYLYSGAHGGGRDTASYILTLGSGGLGLDDGADEGFVVFLELLGSEADLAYGAVDDVCLIETILNLAGLGLLHGLLDIGCDGAGLGRGHKSLGAQKFASLPTIPIISGVAMTVSNSNQFSFWIFSMISCPPT